MKEQALAELAGKIGGLTEQAWQSLLKQAYISAWFDLAYVGLALLASGICLFFYRKAKREEWDEMGRAMLGAGIVGSLLIVLLLIIVSAYAFVIAYSNPEYFAVRQIFGRSAP